MNALIHNLLFVWIICTHFIAIVYSHNVIGYNFHKLLSHPLQNLRQTLLSRIRGHIFKTDVINITYSTEVSNGTK